MKPNTERDYHRRIARVIEATGSLEAVRVEGGLYASHQPVAPFALIGPTFAALFGGWLPQSGYEPDDRPAFEFYRNQAAPDRQHECITDLMIPIRKE